MKKREKGREKKKRTSKKKLIPENTDVFAKLVNSGSCREEAVPLISAETFHDRVRTPLQIVRANISESSLMPFVMRMKRSKQRRVEGKRIRNKKKGRDDKEKRKEEREKRRKTSQRVLFVKPIGLQAMGEKERGRGRRRKARERAK